MVGRSKVWQLAHFVDGGRSEVKCNLCPTRIKFVGNTTNIARHLEIKHPVEFAALDPLASAGTIQQRHEQLHRHQQEKQAQQKEEEAICRILAQHRAELDRKTKKKEGTASGSNSSSNSSSGSVTNDRNSCTSPSIITGTIALTPGQIWSWHTPVLGLTGADDRGSSEFSQNEDETTGNASPEHFLGETSEREPTPAPVVQTPPKPESYQLRHNNHLTIVLEALARDEAFMDVTLTAQGRSLKAHKSVLSAVSPYFRGVLRDNPCQHPIIIMPRDVRFEELFSIVNYIYKGEMTVAAEDLTSLLKTAEILQVSGLAPSDSTATVNPHNIRSSSASSSSSSSNIPHISKVSKTIKEPNRGISAPVARAKSPENMINPSDFMDMDMTYVKEEVESGGEEEPAAASEMTSTPSTQQPEQIASPKTNDTQQQESMTFSSMYNQNQEQTMTPTSGFSHETSNNVPVKSETEADGRQDTDQLQNGTENPQPFVCPHCQGQHRGIENMNSHLRLNHPTKPSFPCLCGRVFIRSMSHQIHIKTCSTASS